MQTFMDAPVSLLFAFASMKNKLIEHVTLIGYLLIYAKRFFLYMNPVLMPFLVACRQIPILQGHLQFCLFEKVKHMRILIVCYFDYSETFLTYKSDLNFVGQLE